MASTIEQQENLLVPTELKKDVSVEPFLQRSFFTRRNTNFLIIVLLFAVIGGIGIAHLPRRRPLENEENPALQQGKAQSWDWNQNYRLDNSNSPRNRNRQHSQTQQSMRQQKSSSNVGRMNIYIKGPQEGSTRRQFERIPFPAARFDRRQLPLSGPFFTFMPRIPIFADRVTRQTIIYAETGVYIIPPLVNAYGKLYSVAELIASGYASLVSAGSMPIGPINMAPYFIPTPIAGRGVPRLSPSKGGFLGSVHTDFGTFTNLKQPKLDPNTRDDGQEDDDEDQYEFVEQYNNRPRSNPYYHQHPHRTRRPKQPISDRTSHTKTPPTKKINTSSTSTSGKTSTPTKPREVHYTLIIDKIYPFPTSTKPIISVNYSFPGPLLEAYEDDTFVIRVINQHDDPSTLHWHGLFQRGTPDMDGAVGLTQCAIPPGGEMTYRFKAKPAGSTWYHGHLLQQYPEGLYGPLIIHPRNESNQFNYENDHAIMIADWYNKRVDIDLFPNFANPNNTEGVEPVPNAIVVNGNFTQSLYFSMSGSRYSRLRIINAAAFSMYTVSIDGLPLHIIEIDSVTTLPYTVSSFTLHVGQRVAFYIDLTELDSIYTATGTSPTNALYIRIVANPSQYFYDIVNLISTDEAPRYPYPTFFDPLFLAFLTFNSTKVTPSYIASSAVSTLSNAPVPSEINILDARPLIRNNDGIPNATHLLYLELVFDVGADLIIHPFLNNVAYSSDANYMHMRPDPTEGITSDLYDPILHQMAEKPTKLNIASPLTSNGNTLLVIQSDNNGHYLIPYKAVVDVIVNNTDGGVHPFHLHGYNFWVIATSDYPEAETLYAGDYLQRDVVSLPSGGWVKLRFVADNPGAWFFHCHIDWHMSAGLAAALLVSPEQLLTNGYTISKSQKQVCVELQRFTDQSNGTKLFGQGL